MLIERTSIKLLTLCLALMLASPRVEAGPVYGVDFQKQGFNRVVMMLKNPDPYNHIPAGRAGGTIGLAVLPRLTPDSDDEEKALGGLVGHIPSIDMAITLPNNDIMYLFKFLKHLKDTGRKVDVLLIGGHCLVNDPDNPDPIGINLKASGVIDTVNINVGLLQRRIENLAAEGKNPKQLQTLCEQLKLMREGSSALVPGAQLLLHSCYLGSEKGENLTKILGTSFLGVNGGTAYGPEKVIAHTLLSTRDPKDEPKTFIQMVKAGIYERSIQVGQSFKSKKWLTPGDAFVNTNAFSYTKIPKGSFQIPCQCDQQQTNGVMNLKRSAPEIQQAGSNPNVRYKVNENSIVGTHTVNGTTYTTTVAFTPPPPVITQKKPFVISGSLTNDSNNSPHVSISHGAAFDMPDGFFLTKTDLHDSVELVTWTNPSERQRRENWISLQFELEGETLTETWRYPMPVPSPSAPANQSSAPTSLQSKLVMPTQSAKPSPRQVLGKSSVSTVSFRRTGPFVTQKDLIPGNDLQVAVGENEVTFSGKDMYKKQSVSCRLTFTPPPEEISVGDNFMLSASLSGHEDVAPIAGFLVGGWIKPAGAGDKNIGLGKDFCVPSNSSSYQVFDLVSEFDKMAKANPAQAAKFAAYRNKLPEVKLHCSGGKEISIEWRYVRK